LNPKDCEKTYPISDKELELILQTNENLPTDELEIPVRDLIVMEIRERQQCATHTSPPALEVCEEQDACRIPAMCPEVTTADRKAREQVLKEVIRQINSGEICEGSIESLRAQQEEQE
jgi:hypothetical protein